MTSTIELLETWILHRYVTNILRKYIYYFSENYNELPHTNKPVCWLGPGSIIFIEFASRQSQLPFTRFPWLFVKRYGTKICYDILNAYWIFTYCHVFYICLAKYNEMTYNNKWKLTKNKERIFKDIHLFGNKKCKN